jgi:hypothetical protein
MDGLLANNVTGNFIDGSFLSVVKPSCMLIPQKQSTSLSIIPLAILSLPPHPPSCAILP